MNRNENAPLEKGARLFVDKVKLGSEIKSGGSKLPPYCKMTHNLL